MTMIEKVARAIQEKAYPNFIPWLTCIDMSKAAIEAMREPTKEMVSPTWDAPNNDDKLIWRRMIDAALKD